MGLFLSDKAEGAASQVHSNMLSATICSSLLLALNILTYAGLAKDVQKEIADIYIHSDPVSLLAVVTIFASRMSSLTLLNLTDSIAK